MKKIAILLAAGVVLAGCNPTATRNWLADPQTAVAAKNATKFAMAVECGVIVPATQLSTQIAQIVKAGEATISTTGKVTAVSVAVCTAITNLLAAQ